MPFSVYKRIMKNKQNIVWLLLAPMIIFLICFTLIPLFSSAIDSMFEVSLLNTSSRSFVGLSNYKSIITDTNIQTSFTNTAFYLITALIIESFLGIILALGLQNNFKLRGVIIAILMIPWALPPLVNGILWRFIFDPSNGLWNSILKDIGILETYRIWLNDPLFSKWCVITVHIWKMLPLITILFLARLQTLSEEIIESSKLDGAGVFQRFKTIILPHISPVFFITLAQGTIGAFHLFDEAFVMTGTALDTRSLLIQDYLIAFREYNLGNGMALALVISIIILVLMIGYSKISSKEEK